MSEHALIGSRAWAQRRSRDPAIEIRRVYENLREFAVVQRTTGHGESETGRQLSAAFTNYAELKDAMRRARFTTGEYVAFTLCVVAYCSVAITGHAEGSWLDAPLSYTEYAAEFQMESRVVAEKVESACRKLSALIYDAP